MAKFVKLNRINEKNHTKMLDVDIDEIAFISEAEPHINYDKPTKFEEQVNVDTGETEQVPVEWEVQERFVIAFKNGKHPQFLDRENYEKLDKLLPR